MLRGVRWVFIALPVWWVLGLEQFVWPIALGCAALWLIRGRGALEWHPLLLWLGALLGAMLVSAAAIDVSHRWLTFGRTTGAYVAAFLLGFVILNHARRQDDVESLLSALLWMMASAAVLGLVGLTGLWRPSLDAPIGFLAPAWIEGSAHGNAITTRSLGGDGWFLGGQYFRLTSLFLWATTYATALVVAVPVVLYKLGRCTGRARRGALVGLLILLLVNLAWTTGRMALIGFGIGAIYWLSWRSSHDRRSLATLMAVALTLAALGAVIIGPARVVTAGSGFVSSVLYARGSGTVDSRAVAYGEAFRGIEERPVHGWGTERDFGGPISAGSHSYYIGITFRHGVLALMILFGVAITWWRSTEPVRVSGPPPFSVFARWAMIAVAVMAVTSSIDLDTTTLLAVALVGWSAIRLGQLEKLSAGQSCSTMRSPTDGTTEAAGRLRSCWL